MDTGTDGYELGEEVTARVRTRNPAGIVVSTRLERDIADRLSDISESTGKTLSQVVREAVLDYLEHGPSRGKVITGIQFTMGTPGGYVNAVFTARNSLVTSSGLADHTERVVPATKTICPG